MWHERVILITPQLFLAGLKVKIFALFHFGTTFFSSVLDILLQRHWCGAMQILQKSRNLKKWIHYNVPCFPVLSWNSFMSAIRRLVHWFILLSPVSKGNNSTPSTVLWHASGPLRRLFWPPCIKEGCLSLAEMGSEFVCLAIFSAHQAK